MMNKIIKIIFVVFLLFGIVSCNMYHQSEIVKYGETIIESKGSTYLKIVNFSNHLVKDTCAMNHVSVSPVTDGFRLSEFVYNKNNDNVEDGRFIEIEPSEEAFIRKNIPLKETSTFVFVKDTYFSFKLRKCRSYNEKYAKLIYFYDKDKFKKLFANYVFYDKENIKNIDKTESNWVYFYDEHWAITTSSSFYHKTINECKEILML